MGIDSGLGLEYVWSISLTTKDNLNHLKTPRGLRVAQAKLEPQSENGQNPVTEFVEDGGVIITLRRIHLPPEIRREISDIADQLDTTSDWIVRVYTSSQTAIPDGREDTEDLRSREATILELVSRSIEFLTIPSSDAQIPTAQRLEEKLNQAVASFEAFYIKNLLNDEIIREELRTTMRALIPLAVVELIIFGAESLENGPLAKYALLLGSDMVMSLIDAFVQKERLNQSLLQALISRWYEPLALSSMATPFVLAMEQLQAQGKYLEMALAYTASMILSTAISLTVSGLAGIDRAIPKAKREEISQGDWQARLFRRGEYYLQHLSSLPYHIRHFLQNPAAQGPMAGMVGGSAVMLTGAQAGMLETKETRMLIEVVAGAMEVVGLFLRVGLIKLENWFNYCSMANKMMGKNFPTPDVG